MHLTLTLTLNSCMKAQLDAERRHIAKLQSELSAYEAAANFNLDALENGLSGATNDNAVKTLNR